MQGNEYHFRSEKKKVKKQYKCSVFILVLVTLFLTSFSATAFILVKTNQLTFAGDNQKNLQQEVHQLKTELARKNSEIEELKLQIANAQGTSHFTNSSLFSDRMEDSAPQLSPDSSANIQSDIANHSETQP